MSLQRIREIIDQGRELGVETIYFEGGEPFLYFPLLMAGIDQAHDRGLKIGLVTNGYWATNEDDTRLWLEPLLEKGVVDLSVSIDDHHGGDVETSHARMVEKVAKDMGLPVNVLAVGNDPEGGLYYRGRAADKLAIKAEKRPIEELGGCPEDPPNIRRLHIDPYGNVLFCQGVSLGNMDHQSLTGIINEFVPEKHPIIGPLMIGLDELIWKGGFGPDEAYADACHLCYAVRSNMIDRRMYRFMLKPLQAYGMENMD
jgi:hypothetical protein